MLAGHSPLMVCPVVGMLGLNHADVLIHVDGCHDLPGLICGVAISSVEGPARVEAHLACHDRRPALAISARGQHAASKASGVSKREQARSSVAH